jgi:N6-adenosine-specific RNA methylase IME4
METETVDAVIVAPESDQVIERLDRCRTLLAECRTVEEAKRIADISEAARVYAKRCGMSRDVVNEAAEYKLRAERRLGEIWKDSEKSKGRPGPGRGKAGSPAAPAFSNVPTLAEVGISKKLASRSQKLADEPEEIFEAKIAEARDGNEGELTTELVLRELKREELNEKLAALSNAPAPLPTGPFNVVVVDPPWTYDKRAGDVTHRAVCPYPSMTIDEIKALPIGRDVEGESDLACDDAVVWLWTTNAHLRWAFEILDEWGFAYKTMLTWVKDRMGVGDWLRGRTEHCLLAVRGKPLWNLTNQTTVVEGAMREHSRKPEEFYKLVEGLCPGSKLDMFGRTQRDGWTVHGNEASKFSEDVVLADADNRRQLFPSEESGEAVRAEATL